VQEAGVPEVVGQTIKIGAKTTSGRGGRYCDAGKEIKLHVDPEKINAVTAA
jgi:hypothetical protein